MQIPGYLEKVDDLKNLGLDEVIVFCVNDGAVMNAWAKDQKIPDDSIITFMGDPNSMLTVDLDLELTHPGPIGKGLIRRGKRAAMYIDHGKFKAIRIAEKPDDPAGDDHPDVTLVDSMIEVIRSSMKDEL